MPEENHCMYCYYVTVCNHPNGENVCADYCTTNLDDEEDCDLDLGYDEGYMQISD